MSGRRGWSGRGWKLAAVGLGAALVPLVWLLARPGKDGTGQGGGPGDRAAELPGRPSAARDRSRPLPPPKLVAAPPPAAPGFAPPAPGPLAPAVTRNQALAVARAQAGKPSQPPAWFKLEVESIQKQQAVQTLAGVLRDEAEGRRVDVSALPRDVQDLYRAARRHPGRALGPRPQPRRTLEALAVPPRKPLGWLATAGRERRQAAGGSRPVDVRGQTLALTFDEPAVPADRAPTLDAPSDHPAIAAQAAALGNDPIRIHGFVRDQIETELYHGSKKGALGTLRERAGNDGDQASLLVALLRAAGVAARYEIGTVSLSEAQAAEYTGAQNLTAAAALLSTAGIGNQPLELGPGQGFGLEMEHVWVRAYVPVSAYRGLARPGSSFGWAHLSPAIKQMRTHAAVNLRDAVVFDLDAYLATRTAQKPSEAFGEQLRTYIRTNAIACETLDSAIPGRAIVPADLPLLPAELPVRRVSSAYAGSALPAAARHLLKVQGFGSQGQSQLAYQAPMAALWGKSVTLVYLPATAQDEATLASYGGLEHTPAYLVRLRGSLRIDGVEVAAGIGEYPGLVQTLVLDSVSPASGPSRVEHVLTVGSVYAFALDPGLVPADLIGERQQRLAGLTGDDREAEKLHISGLTYFRELGTARQRIAGLHWHRVFKEVEEAMVAVELRVQGHQGTPLSVKRDFFMLDAALVRSGNLSVDGDSRRRVRVAELTGYESSFLEHRVGELFYGARQFSAVNLIQSARQRGVTVVNVRGVEDLQAVQWPAEFEQRIEDALARGLQAKVPATGQVEPGLGTLFGYLATHPDTGAGEYIVAFQTGTLNAQVNGGVGDVGPEPGGGGSSPECGSCGGMGPAESQVHLGSGNYVHQETDLTLPARGIPLALTRTYSSLLGWHHNYGQRIEAVSDGSLRYIDEMGVPRLFAAGGAGVWQPPPRFFQVIEAEPGGGYRMTFKDGIVYRFDALGRLASQADLNGHAVALSYNAEGRLAQVSGAGGATFTFEHQPATGLLARVTDSAGRQVSFEYDGGGRIALERDVLGKERRYTYDSAGRMRSKTNLRGDLTEIAYDGVGRVVRFEDPEGGVRSYAYDERNRRTVMVDRTGQPLLWELSELGQPVRTVDALGNETAMAYDARGNKTEERDARGNATVYTHDAAGNVLTIQAPLSAPVSHTYTAHARLETTTDAAGTTWHTYTPEGNLETTTDPLSNVTRYDYVAGLPVRITRPGTPASVTEMTYSPEGNVESMTDPEGGVTLMRYTADGHLREIEDANHHVRTMEVDDRGQVRVMRDAQARPVARYDYDADGNRTKQTDFEGRETRMAYDKLGRLTTTTDAQQNVTQQIHDAEGRVIARVDARGNRTEMRYDAIGRLLAVKDPLGNETRMGYCAELAQQACVTVDAYGNSAEAVEDELGRVVAQEDALGNTLVTEYDNLGRRQEVRDPAGNATRFGYDTLGRLTAVTDAYEKVTAYGYDARGNRETVTDANQKTTQFTYDRANRLRLETTPIGTTTEYRYDAAGNRIQKIDGKAQVTTYTYDGNRRLTDITYQGGTTAHFEYDVDGNRLLERNVDSERHMTYDALNRLATVTDVQTGRTIGYTYDANGNRTSMTVTPDAETTRYGWDARNLLVRLTDPEGGVYRFSYDKLGRRVHTSYPNGMTLDTTYDAASRVTLMAYRKASGEVIESFGYTYDTRGNRTSKRFADGGAEVYGYDKLSRLIAAAYPGGRDVRYVYDAVGNRLEMREGLSSAGSGAAQCPADQDCDGVADGLDNCPAVANATQADADGDAASGGGAWRFDEPSGSTAIDLNGKSDGTLAGGASRVPGRFGGGVFFMFGLPAVNMPNTPALNLTGTDITLSAWIKAGQGNFGPVIYKEDQYRLSYGDGTIVYGDSTNWGLASGGAGFQYNQWNHVAAVRSATRIKLYMNGAQVADLPATGSVTTRPAPLKIGCCENFRPFPGEIDEVAVYNRSLTPAQIAQLATTPAQPSSPPPLGDACDPCLQSNNPQCSPTTCRDTDADGYGLQGASACSAGDAAKFDCNDSDPTIHPAAMDTCDGVDNDCDGRVDEACLTDVQTTTYVYNAFNQLLSSTGPGGTTTYEYDLNGNQVRKVEAETVASTDYVYDVRDRMVQVRRNAATVAEYGYDVRNLLVRVREASSDRRILLDGGEELAMYGDLPESPRVARYDHDPGRIDAVLADFSGRKNQTVTDALGSVYALTDAAGNVQTRYSYDAFGDRASSNSPSPWGFSGRRHDEDGLYVRQRWYLPSQGVWIVPDPAGLKDGVNRYSYVAQNPVNWIDPLGLYKIYIIGIKAREMTENEFGPSTQFYERWVLRWARQLAMGLFGAEEVFYDLENDGSALLSAASDPEVRGLYVAAHGAAGVLESKRLGLMCPLSGCKTPVNGKRFGPQIEIAVISACNAGEAISEWKSALGGVADIVAPKEDVTPLGSLGLSLRFLSWIEDQRQQIEPGWGPL
jgi:RHS repeat-associated protein